MDFEPVDFSNVHEGDTVTFSRRDNGFGGSGDIVARTGTVTKVTDKTVTVECIDRWGKTGVLRRADWHYRNVRRTAKADRRPYNAENVQYVDAGLIVTAVWVSDPAVDPAEALESILRRDLPYEMEVVGEATRFFKKEGAGFSGWVVSTGGGLNYGDAIPTKRQAMKELRWAVAERFAR
ncbi:hypothetical protein [Streptomyces silvensis]|uniref:Uncharacterized protein n=1 Tax=Streptomyces silvensis TaxID=1765722 RepID=A0A0W7X7J1_9ACTN|nr:hypothetical protein [Streptomyces silvensis]KUF18824.1 hypothetical protein AT728_07250 [Streptomyces silvensis]